MFELAGRVIQTAKKNPREVGGVWIFKSLVRKVLQLESKLYVILQVFLSLCCLVPGLCYVTLITGIYCALAC